jgi:hypothetical protein
LTEGGGQGRKTEGKNNRLYKEFQTLYETTYSKLGYAEKIDPVNLSGIAEYAFTGMITAVENNIKSQYHNYVRRFVNKTFNPQIDRECEKIKDKELRAKTRKELKKKIAKVKNDIFEGTLDSDQEYHAWILLHREHMIPSNYVFEKIYTKPQIFLPCMKYISQQLEEMGCKTGQFFPLRTNLIPKHIILDTKALIELFAPPKTTLKRLSTIRTMRDTVWGETFRTKHKAFRRRNYIFKYMLTTNGYDASIIFAETNRFMADERKSINRVKASNKAKALYKGKSAKEKELLKEKMEEEREKKKAEYNEQKKREKAERKEQKEEVPDEFPYLEDVSSEEHEQIQAKPYGIIDMGKIRIITMLNPNDKKNPIFTYSQKEHIHRTGRRHFAQKIQGLKNSLAITSSEAILSEYSGKTCNFRKFKDYISTRNSLLPHLTSAYSDIRFRKWNFHLHVNTTRAYDNLTNHIHAFLTLKTNEKKRYTHIPKSTPTPALIIGDWSARSTLKHNISTPGIGLKRKLAKRFKIYSLDEYRSSKLHYKTEQPTQNLTITKHGRSRKVHSVLTCKMENNQIEYINRDRNAVYNMKKFIEHIFEYGTYPLRYRRGYVLS